ncbi:hypothetical protein EauS123_00040 [Exiguobacterium phage vB_EauS-123]|nr:hypothetical protein EauS123_00040 [Exiguobacterium phage vB_EauS-123]
MYKVIKAFTDLQDGKHVYNVGDTFPHKGRAAKKRLEELSGDKNKVGRPLIEEVSEDE